MMPLNYICAMNSMLEQDITFLKGVGPKRASLLNSELQIFNYEDLLYYFPYKYIDRSKFHAIREIHGKMPYVQIKGKLLSFRTIGEGRKTRLTAVFTDGSHQIDLIWFKGIKWVKEKVPLNVELVIFGKPSVFNGMPNIVHPEIESISENNADLHRGAFQAAYHTSEKMKNAYLGSKALVKVQQNLWESIGKTVHETLPMWFAQKMKLMALPEALSEIHAPSDTNKLKHAQFRLKFEEFFFIQLKILSLRSNRRQRFMGNRFAKIGDTFNNFYNQCLPFELTGAQKRVLREIRIDAGSGRQMNRLVQGDVGSGKTLVALMSMLMALDNGYQACLMAPTEILATQHFLTIAHMVEPIGIKVDLLTGSTRAKKRKVLHSELQSGELHILVGTHALIEKAVVFENLGIVVVDEQHRFGVAQRAKLWGKNKIPPHVLVMTATPIPRTLAMTIYGDLDVSVIDELPPGRKPIQTMHFHDNNRKKVYDFMRKELQAGRQAYIVYPLIEESEKMDYQNLTDGHDVVQSVFPEYKISMVHGRMKPDEKDAEMMRFKNKETQIMVATTVIEVGVDVPNASIMIIESSERFGLSQLHQLRGRVGRGGDQSYCVLMSSYKLSKESNIRIDAMVRTTDGFDIAETDLKLRGPGDLQGTQQSGLGFDLKIAKLGKDDDILKMARNEASEILEADPLLESDRHIMFKKRLAKMKKSSLNWSVIS